MSFLQKQLMIKHSYSLFLITYIFRRKYLYQDVGLEIFFTNGDSCYLVFETPADRDEFYSVIKKYVTQRFYRYSVPFFSLSLVLLWISVCILPLASWPLFLLRHNGWIARSPLMITYWHWICLLVVPLRILLNILYSPGSSKIIRVPLWIWTIQTSIVISPSQWVPSMRTVWKDSWCVIKLWRICTMRMKSASRQLQFLSCMVPTIRALAMSCFTLSVKSLIPCCIFIFKTVCLMRETVSLLLFKIAIIVPFIVMVCSIGLSCECVGDVKELTPEWYSLSSFLKNNNHCPLGKKQVHTASE